MTNFKDECKEKGKGKVIIDICKGHLEKLKEEDYTIVENPHKDGPFMCYVGHCGRMTTLEILVSCELADYLNDTYIELDDDPEEIAMKIKAAERLRKTAEILATKKHKELWTRAQAFYDHQKLRIAQFNRIGMYEKLNVDMSGLEWYPIAMKEIEDRFQKEMLQFVKKEKVWNEFLSKVKGIGPVMAAGLIAWFDDPAKANTPSKMWKYAGLGVTDGKADRRRKGEKELGFNPKLKVHMWKIGKQLSFAKGNYYQYYLEQKEMISQKHAPKTDVESLKPDERKKYWQEHPDEWPNGKMHSYALRKMQKLFLANFWEAWRISEGLPTPPPYAEAILGHVDIIHYWEMVDRKTDVVNAGKNDDTVEDEIDD